MTLCVRLVRVLSVLSAADVQPCICKHVLFSFPSSSQPSASGCCADCSSLSLVLCQSNSVGGTGTFYLSSFLSEWVSIFVLFVLISAADSRSSVINTVCSQKQRFGKKKLQLTNEHETFQVCYITLFPFPLMVGWIICNSSLANENQLSFRNTTWPWGRWPKRVQIFYSIM